MKNIINSKGLQAIDFILEISNDHIEHAVAMERQRLQEIADIHQHYVDLCKPYGNSYDPANRNIMLDPFYRTMAHMIGDQEMAEDFSPEPRYYRLVMNMIGSRGKAERMADEIRLARSMNQEKWDAYLEIFRASCLAKLQKAIDKHLSPSDEAIEGLIRLGSKGIEILCDIKGKGQFFARAVFAGGMIQCYHYRYVSHLTAA